MLSDVEGTKTTSHAFPYRSLVFLANPSTELEVGKKTIAYNWDCIKLTK